MPKQRVVTPSSKSQQPGEETVPPTAAPAAEISISIEKNGDNTSILPIITQTVMPTRSDPGPSVPAFLAKLWRLVENPETNNLICWSESGESFIIKNKTKFERELLPMNYKHNNMASFIRQLNMYGFHKVASPDTGGLRFDRDEVEFQHRCFRQHCVYLLDHIKRKITANTKNSDESIAVQDEFMNKINKQMRVIQGRTDKIEHSFNVMRRENASLWREVVGLRHRYQDQKKIINRLLHAIVLLAHHSNIPILKHIQRPLMIHDNPENSNNAQNCAEDNVTNQSRDVKGEGNNIQFITSNSSGDNLLMLHSNEDSALKKTQYDEDSLSPMQGERPQSSVSILSHQCNDFSDEILDPHLIDENEDSIAMYQVTEFSDAHSPEAPLPMEDSNVLRTPLVMQREASRALKTQNKQRKHAASLAGDVDGEPPAKLANNTTSDRIIPKPIKVKIEPEIDSVLLDVLQDSNLDPILMSTNIQPSDDTQNSNINISKPLLNVSEEDFLTSDLMSSELFQDSVEAINLGETDDLYTLDTALNNGRFSDALLDSNSMTLGNNQPSTSAAAASNNAGTSTSKAITPRRAIGGGKNMAVAKYLPGKPDDRLSTADNVSSQLNGVQRELDSIKDLFVNQNVDNNLFNLNDLFTDTDIFNPYSLSAPYDLPTQTTGSELMAYQPNYDLTDIMNLQEEDSQQQPIILNVPAAAMPAPGSQNTQPTTSNAGSSIYIDTGSVLNTPYRDNSGG